MTDPDSFEGYRRAIADVRHAVRAEAARNGWTDVADLLDGSAADETDAVRVVVAGETKRGKSRLINSIVGRPGLSPVDVDVTTACPVALSYGVRDQAVALLADPHSAAAPVRRPIGVFEVERYVALQQITDPVLGVEVRLPSPALDGMVLVDTPGVGGLDAGHSRITLSALGRADALLFVCDSSQPILAPEMDFLSEAAGRITAITIAVTKSDLNGADVVAAETRRRVAARADLAGVPVLTVSAALAERAADVEDPTFARRMLELSGMTALTAALRRQAEADNVTLRLANGARLTGTIARLLIDRARRWIAEADGSADQERRLTDEIDRLHELLADRARLRLMVAQHAGRLRSEPADEFRERAAELGRRYRGEAERGPAAQLSTLAPRLIADLTAAAGSMLEDAAEQSRRVMSDLLDATGSSWSVATGELELGLAAPALSGPSLPSALAHAARIYPTVTALVAGSGVAVSVLTGPGIVAACIAVAAGAGWWKVWGETEQQRRTELETWINSAEDEAVSSLGREIRRRVRDVEQYAESALVGLLTAEQAELTARQAERAALRIDGARAREDARHRHDAVEQIMRPLAARADDLLRQLSGRPERRRNRG